MDKYNHMSYASLQELHKHDHTWRLLNSDNGPFIIAFLHEAFLAENQRDVAEAVLVEALENFMDYHQIEKSRSAKEYLTIWSDENHYLLRRFHKSDHNGNLIVQYDLTPFAVKGIAFIESLRGHSYISTESRLVTVFHLLEDIALKSSEDAAERIASLQEEKIRIDGEIARIQQGQLDTLSDQQIKERFMQAVEVSRQIISDFREVEANFRDLHQQMRRNVASWEEGKGAFLDVYFQQEQSIEQSEQGRSFEAFWSFLFSRDQQQDFHEMLGKILSLESIQSIENSHAMLEVEGEWIEGGERIQNTVALLSGQLRQYISETYLAEEKRINQLIRQIENLGHQLRTHPPKEPIWELDAHMRGLSLSLDRPLFTPPVKLDIQPAQLEKGVMEELAPELFAQHSIDRVKLVKNINDYLCNQSQVTLEQVVSRHPLRQGIGELLTYLEIAHFNEITEDDGVFVSVWQDEAQMMRRAKIPNLVFCKEVI